MASFAQPGSGGTAAAATAARILYERVYTRPTALNCEAAQSDLPILRLAGYCEEPTGQIIGWAAQGTKAEAWSPDYGDYWANITARDLIQDFAFESQTILYNLYMAGTVQKLPYTGTSWGTTLPAVNTGVVTRSHHCGYA